ncbi:formylmethanofuran--tetrahydromethanopterin N-formyltransferase [Candidatus Hecatella orcuttiae]|uniref:formylmethanofuran--tetrahydromethanopterin N-formyltransferase n=1 Tax=Candidatus Hecatella orcuttiae TaxID=1935119 RepID=UPI0028681D38|nr:formylmethanofuran--tetrahydromethanopterin N-formyltransferase [Candidatus Hecatella orcuttiae]
MSKQVEIEDTFAEAFPMWVSRFLITAENEKWALTSARAATGFAVSIIMSPAEAGVEKTVSGDETPDGRPGAIVHIYHSSGHGLKDQLLRRIGQCVLTCPTTAAFDALGSQAVKRLKIGASIRYFGDGFQKKDTVKDRTVWRIPVMEGEFLIESRFGVKLGVAGGNFLVLAENAKAGLEAAERAVEAVVGKVDGVVMSFPGGVCRSGSKVGSMKYKLPASTNHLYCPVLRDVVSDTLIPEGVKCVYELIFNGINLASVKEAMKKGIEASAAVPGVVKISAANFGGKLGPYKIYLKKLGLSLP